MQQQENINQEFGQNQQPPKPTSDESNAMNDKEQRENGAEGESFEHTTEKLHQELDDLKDKYLRTVAEMDNLRKRVARERTDLLRFGSESLLRDILPVLDSFEKACQEGQKDQDSSQYLQGMTLVRKQLFDVLERHGLKAIEAEGQSFDPNLHQAIQRIESDEVSEDRVHQEFAKGYMLHDRLLRPAMVSVAVPGHKDETKE